ncbi:alpha-parvin [Brachionus plicatilis]|uniref:Alpha-parvin n=1 Tax=Brachionus plicatilis TaxID=10195 RepID=A0A3M7QIN4_BRAPC|nr:alpha-parvin [Brachionus plicatilis]
MSKKSSSVFDKFIPLGTIQRRNLQKKQIKELTVEGINAIQAIQSLKPDPEAYELKENDKRTALEINEKKKLEPLIEILIEWINYELSDKRVIVKDLEQDLYDGQILQMLIEKLSGLKLTGDSRLNLGELSQKQNLKQILNFINQTMEINPIMSKWKVEDIYDKDLIAILHLLVAIVKFFDVKISLPENITVKVIIIQKKKTLEKVTVIEKITGINASKDIKKDRDAFDTLFEHAPDKLELVKNSLLTFMRKHLGKLRIEIESLENLDDGVLLILLMGLLEDFYIPDFAYVSKPSNYDEKLTNCKFLFDLIDEVCRQEKNCHPEDIANGDLKSILRILYLLFSNYKDRD